MKIESISLLLVIPFLFFGCQEASRFLDHAINPKVHETKASSNALNSCNIDKTISLVSKNQNELLKNLELGLGYYFNNNLKQSNTYFGRATNLYRMNEDKAIIDISTLLRKEYQGEGYDKVFLHNYQAINYLLMGNAEEARVEVKNSNFVQEQEKKKLKEFVKKNSKSNKNSILISRYQKLFDSVNPQHNPYQNPYAYYISALAYAEERDYDNARIDIQRAIKFAPDSKMLEEKLKSYQHGKAEKTVEIFFDIGQSPLKSQVQLPLDMENKETRMAYMPSFIIDISDIEYIKITDSKGKEVARSSLLVDINAIKINEFQQKLPSIIYLISKEAMTSITSATLEGKSKFITGLFNATRAIYGQNDISTWSLLPQKILVASFVPNDEEYEIIVVSKDEKVLNQYPLRLLKSSKTKNIYRHFTLRGNELCKQ